MPPPGRATRTSTPARQMATDAHEHPHHFFGELVRCRARVVVEHVLLGDECREIVEQRGVVVLHEQVVGVALVVEDGAGIRVEAAAFDPVGAGSAIGS